MRIRDISIATLIVALLPWRAGATPTPVPAVIQAEAYEEGGEGTGYHDATPGNSGGALRSDDVDIFSGGVGEHHVGDTSAGEWLEFTISVESGFDCQLRYRVAAVPASAVFNLRLEVDGITKDVVVTRGTGGAPPATGTPSHTTTTLIPTAPAAGRATVFTRTTVPGASKR